MNLGKLFNFKYLKQNIKKSKGLITLLILVIPVITALILIGNNASDYANPTLSVIVSIANFFGMYGIPVILSFLLYGYVYKKNSVDFVNSMPLTRSTIFVTNFIGGLILILIIQVLTALVSILGTIFLSKIFIAPQMILDIFIVMLLAYIFVYSATTIAMTISGNFLTQIVVTMLIVFLIPFTFTVGFAGIQKTVDIELANRQTAINNYSITHYTLPSFFFTDMLGIGSFSFYDTTRNIKMLILSVIYFAIGLYLFNKRKMENVEASFSKTWVHLVVKGITLLPMVFAIQLIDLRGAFYWIAVALVFIYYCLYDFITNRKVSIKFTLPCFIVSFAVLFGLYNGMQRIGIKLYKTSISVSDIQEISIETVDYYRMSSVSDWLSSNRKMNTNISISDKDLINKILENIVDVKNRNYPEYYYPTNTEMIYLKMKTKNKEFYTTTAIELETYKEVIDYLIGNQKNLEKYDGLYEIGKDAYIISNEVLLSKEDTKKLIELYNNTDIKKILEKENEFGFYFGNQRKYMPQPSFTVYYYKNHYLHQVNINPFLSQEIFDKMLEVAQKRTKDIIDIYDSAKDNYIDVYVNDKRKNQYVVQEDFSNGSLMTNKGIIEYVKQHLNEKIDMNDTFYVISLYLNYPNQATIYLKETDELNFILDRDTYNENTFYIDKDKYETHLDDLEYKINYTTDYVQ